MKSIFAIVATISSIWFLADGILSSPIEFPASQFHRPVTSCDSVPNHPLDVTLPEIKLETTSSSARQLPSINGLNEFDGIRFAGNLSTVNPSHDSVVLFVECFRTFRDTIQIVESTTEIVEIKSGIAEFNVVLRKPSYSGEYTITVHSLAGNSELDMAETEPTMLATGTLQI